MPPTAGLTQEKALHAQGLSSDIPGHGKTIMGMEEVGNLSRILQHVILTPRHTWVHQGSQCTGMPPLFLIRTLGGLARLFRNSLTESSVPDL